MKHLARRRIIVALDVSTEKEALELVEELKDHVGMFKIGLELFTSVGPSIVDVVKKVGGQVFLDTKLFDIPNTVKKTSKAIAKMGVGMFNIHCLGTSEMMRAAKEGAQEGALEAGVRVPAVLGVTILTSTSEESMRGEMGIPGCLEDMVVHLGKLAFENGLDGVVASAKEVEVLRKEVSAEMTIVTPGIRPGWAASGDQKRIVSPYQAIVNGASFLVIGRPITSPPEGISRVQAIERITKKIGDALEDIWG